MEQYFYIYKYMCIYKQYISCDSQNKKMNYTISFISKLFIYNYFMCVHHVIITRNPLLYGDMNMGYAYNGSSRKTYNSAK